MCVVWGCVVCVVCVCVSVYVCPHVNVCCVHVNVCVCLCAYVCGCCVRMCLCACVICVCVCVCLHVLFSVTALEIKCQNVVVAVSCGLNCIPSLLYMHCLAILGAGSYGDSSKGI